VPEKQDLCIQLCFWTPGSFSCGQGLASAPGMAQPPAGIYEETFGTYVSPGLVGCSSALHCEGSF